MFFYPSLAQNHSRFSFCSGLLAESVGKLGFVSSKKSKAPNLNVVWADSTEKQLVLQKLGDSVVHPGSPALKLELNQLTVSRLRRCCSAVHAELNGDQ